MEFGERGYNVFPQGFKGTIFSSSAPNEHIVAAKFGDLRHGQARSLPQTAANAVAHDGIAELLGAGETNTRTFCITTRAALNHHTRHGLRRRFCGCKEIPPVEKPAQRHVILGAEPLAATGPAAGNDLAATNSGHARPKAMPALADEFRGLIGALHSELRKVLQTQTLDFIDKIEPLIWINAKVEALMVESALKVKRSAANRGLIPPSHPSRQKHSL
jgi:hypothetical protein